MTDQRTSPETAKVLGCTQLLNSWHVYEAMKKILAGQAGQDEVENLLHTMLFSSNPSKTKECEDCLHDILGDGALSRKAAGG